MGHHAAIYIYRHHSKWQNCTKMGNIPKNFSRVGATAKGRTSLDGKRMTLL